jgi:hypothetical protein
LADFDLIPPSYHARVRLEGELRRFGWIAAAVLVAVVSARAGVALLAHGNLPRIASLHGTEARLAGQRAEYDKLALRRTDVERSLRMLRDLRGQGGIDLLASAVEDSVDDDVWLRELSYARSGATADAAAEERHVGYMVVVVPTPRPGDQASELAALRQLDHLELKGQATGHRALLEFVKRLGQRPGVRDARLVRTSPVGRPGDGRVEFDVIVLVDPAAGGAR